MLLTVFGTFLATLSAEEVGTSRGEESLLQAMSKGEVVAGGVSTDYLAGGFCPEFFQDEDIQYASMGVQEARKIFIKYCGDAGVAQEQCEDHADAVFRPEGVRGQELNNDMCADLLALSARMATLKSESPTALLARQSDSGRDDRKGMDDTFARKGPGFGQRPDFDFEIPDIEIPDFEMPEFEMPRRRTPFPTPSPTFSLQGYIQHCADELFNFGRICD